MVSTVLVSRGSDRNAHGYDRRRHHDGCFCGVCRHVVLGRPSNARTKQVGARLRHTVASCPLSRYRRFSIAQFVGLQCSAACRAKISRSSIFFPASNAEQSFPLLPRRLGRSLISEPAAERRLILIGGNMVSDGASLRCHARCPVVVFQNHGRGGGVSRSGYGSRRRSGSGNDHARHARRAA